MVPSTYTCKRRAGKPQPVKWASSPENYQILGHNLPTALPKAKKQESHAMSLDLATSRKRSSLPNVMMSLAS